MKILVTGGAGYIGSHTVHLLIQSGWSSEDIIVFDNLIYGHREHLPEGVHFIRGDLLNKSDIASVFQKHKIEGVLHFAAYSYVGESMVDPGKYFENNIAGGLHLLEQMRLHGCQFIVLSSTCSVYGIPEKVPITEDTPLKPINVYGESKLIFEKMLSWYDRIYKIRAVSLRYFNAAGAGFGIGEKHDPETHLLPLTIQAALGQRESIHIYGNDYPTPDGTCIRDFIHVIDLADAHIRALQYLKKGGASDIINLGTGTGTSVQEIINAVRNLSDKNFPILNNERRPGDPAILVADNLKSQKILGWQHQKTLSDIVKSAWEWHLKDGCTSSLSDQSS